MLIHLLQLENLSSTSLQCLYLGKRDYVGEQQIRSKSKRRGRFGRLTAKNKSAEIVELISQGKTTNEVAKELG